MTPLDRPQRVGALQNSPAGGVDSTYEIDHAAMQGDSDYPTSCECAGPTNGGGRRRSGGSSAEFGGDSGGGGGIGSRTREKVAGAVRTSRTEQILEDEEKFLN